jgi:hypothetical protein
MTISDKLRALEDIWDDLQRTPEEIPSPAWHADVLRARKRRIREGNLNSMTGLMRSISS